MIQMSSETEGGIANARATKFARIAQSYGVNTISKAEFDTQFPASQWERYSSNAIGGFYADLKKSEDFDIVALKDAVEGLKEVHVHTNDGVATYFVRAKV